MASIDWNQFTSEPQTTTPAEQRVAAAPGNYDWTQFTTQTPTESNIQQTKQNSNLNVDDVTAPIIAFGSGVAQGGANIANAMGGLVKEFIGHVSPKAKEFLDKGDKALANYVANTEAKNQIPEAQAQYPTLKDVGVGTGMAAGVLAASGAIPEGAIAQATGQGVLGSAMAGEGNRGAGFVGGALIPAIASTATAPLGKFLASNAALPDKIKDLHSSINASKLYPGMNIHEATNASFSKFKEAPGEISTIQPVNNIQNFLTQHKSRLSPTQTQIVEETQQALNSAKNIEDLHNVRKGFTDNLKNEFLTGPNKLVGSTRTDLMNVKNTLENNLQLNAKKLGVLDKYKEANSLYKQSREADQINKAFDQTLQSTGNNDWVAFNNTFKKLRTNQDIKVGSGQTKAVQQAEKDISPETKQQIKGIQETIKEASSLYGIQHTSVRVAGVNIGDMVLNGLKALANVPGGKQILIHVGTPGGRYLAKELVKSIVNIGQASYIKSANAPGDQQ